MAYEVKAIEVKAIEQSKKWYLSKTLWTNFVMGCLVLAIPDLKDKITPELLGWAFVLINAALRLVTKDKLEIK